MLFLPLHSLHLLPFLITTVNAFVWHLLCAVVRCRCTAVWWQHCCVTEAAEAVLEKIDLLKKSILARAFHGELGTNDTSEGGELELIKTVL